MSTKQVSINNFFLQKLVYNESKKEYDEELNGIVTKFPVEYKINEKVFSLKTPQKNKITHSNTKTASYTKTMKILQLKK